MIGLDLAITVILLSSDAGDFNQAAAGVGILFGTLRMHDIYAEPHFLPI